jgi:hypothetical protein
MWLFKKIIPKPRMVRPDIRKGELNSTIDNNNHFHISFMTLQNDYKAGGKS